MYIGEIIKADSANGEGIRVSIFVSGCTNHCKGCFQPQTWNYNYGYLYDDNMENDIINELSQSYYNGLTILGGVPFEISNQQGLLPLIRRIKKELPDKTIWVYTGFTYDVDLVAGGKRYTNVTDEILDSIDILVDGKFVEELKSLMLNFRGSSNQRIIDMRATRKAGKVVLSKLNN